MDTQSHGKQTADTPVSAADHDAAVKAVGTWVQQFARTLKNCRLYDARNAAVLRFRQQLAASLHQLVRERGAVTLRFTSDDVTYEGASLYPARSRDDNLALAFYRDGIRALTFHESVEPRELDALIAALIRVTGQDSTEDDDLVTTLWQAQLQHVEVDYVPPEGEVGAVAGPDGELVPWPTGAEPDPQDPAARELADTYGPDGEPRSDDWVVGTATAELEADFDALRGDASDEVTRFMREFEAEHAESPVTSVVAVARAFLAAETHADDTPELGRFLPRILRLAIEEGLWGDAHECLRLLRQVGDGWSPMTFVQELQQPISLAGLKHRLSGQTEPQIAAFTALARDLGEPAADVLASVLAEFEGGPEARPFAAALVTLCRGNPERLGPWLSDRRPAVVRRIVQILGEIGGNGIVGVMQSAARHPDPQVRAEVFQALNRVDARAAKPLLVTALESGDSRLFCAALQKLSEVRDAEISQQLLLYMVAPEFEERPADEKRAIYSALGATGGDEVIPELEAELFKGGWFERVDESHRQAVARCIARIGTPMARMVIEHGAQSRRSQVRDLCREMLARWESHGD